MPLGKSRYPFTGKMIEGAPHDMNGGVCECSSRATHYSWEIVLQPQLRELELLQTQRETAGGLPPCNAHAA